MPLSEPPAPSELARLSGQSLKGRELHRVFRTSRRSPWWFSSAVDDPDAAGRFDLPRPDGACYLTTTVLGAVLEALQDYGKGVLPVAELKVRRRAVISVPPSAPLAAQLVSAKARGLGVTQALWTGGTRALTQRWARALRRAGWQALWTGTQHDTTGRCRTVTLFDETGEHLPYEDSGWSYEPLPIDDDQEVVDGLARYGIIVLPDLDPPFQPKSPVGPR